MTATADKKRKKEKKKEPVVEQEEKDEDEHPFSIGSHLVVEWAFDKSHRICRVIERMCENPEDEVDESQKRWQYYVHFVDFNRRMDDWVASSQVVELPSKAGPLAKEHEAQRQQLREQQKEADNAAGGEDDEGVRTRRKKTKVEGAGEEDAPLAEAEHDEHEGLDEASLKEHEEVTKVKNIRTIELGRHIMETWYFSPFPKEYFPYGFVDRLYFCEYSLCFFSHRSELVRYQSRGVDPHPPGDEIYRHAGLAMFEVDGAANKEYCQNLCYLAKLFLDHKTLYYDVDPFLFYVLCEYDDRGYHPVGYFSKEKYSDVGYNLACILTLPCYQRKGYGRFIIAFSYELSKKEMKVGSPEKPLSDLGAVSYRSYWAHEVLKVLASSDLTNMSVMDISKQTSIMSDDIITALQYLGLLRYVRNNYIICVPPGILTELQERHPAKGPQVDPEKLHWSPLITDIKGKDKWSIKAKRPDYDAS
mmetsp:Transcript_8445/g.24012  ORF Transcript_8445/g.24012 Transcript_8445/m.24012 type:complete len:474 (-) Transcript_8445:36-1457(-)